MSERAGWRAEVEEIHHRGALAKRQGGPEGIARQRRRGLSTDRETRPVLAEWLELIRPSLKLLPPAALPPWPVRTAGPRSVAAGFDPRGVEIRAPATT